MKRAFACCDIPSPQLSVLRGAALIVAALVPTHGAVWANDAGTIASNGAAAIIHTLDEKTLVERARNATLQKRHAEAAALYEALARIKTIALQDDVTPLLAAASSYQRAGQHDKAIALWERVLTIPAAPGANPPGMMPPPRDYRGEARWDIAQSRRAQGRWTEALELYRLNRQSYPRMDGCIPSGGALQLMAMVEGVCLENLGRPSEAIELYWPAVVHLSLNVSPLALRRLIDSYATAGQLPALDAAMAREAKSYRTYLSLMFNGGEEPLTAEQQKMVERIFNNLWLSSYERLKQLRIAAQEKRWKVLLSELQSGASQQRESSSGEDIPSWERREAIAALMSVSADAIPILENELQLDPKNPNLQAALLLCRASEQERLELVHGDGKQDWEVQGILQEVIGYETVPLQFPKASAPMRLPFQLPPVFQANM